MTHGTGFVKPPAVRSGDEPVFSTNHIRFVGKGVDRADEVQGNTVGGPGGGAERVLVAGCSSAASTRSRQQPAPTTTAAAVTLPSHVPAGTTLRVGDQLDYLKTILHLAGQDKDFPYKVEYSAFVGGPPMLQAFQGGAIDAGFVGSTPLIFAQAAGQHIVAVAGWATPARLLRAGHRARGQRHQGLEGPEGQEGRLPAGHRARGGAARGLDQVGLKL